MRFFNADDLEYFEDITGSCRIESPPYRREINAIYLDDPSETTDKNYSMWGQDVTVLECTDAKIAAQFVGLVTFVPTFCLLP